MSTTEKSTMLSANNAIMSANNAAIAENIPKVYEAGKASVVVKEEQEKTIDITENGTTEVTPDEGKALSKVTVNVAVGGGDSFYDAFWDSYQQNGTRVDYRNAFSGANNWTAETFRPKYDIVYVAGIMTHFLFQNSTMAIDLEQHLKDCGVVISTSVAIGSDAFQNSRFTVIPEIMIKGTGSSNVFADNPNLHTIRKVIVGSKDTLASQFGNLPALENIVFEGEIGKWIYFSQSPLLSDASIQNIIDHLADLTGSTSQKISFHSTVTAKLTDEQILAITSKNWIFA